MGKYAIKYFLIICLFSNLAYGEETNLSIAKKIAKRFTSLKKQKDKSSTRSGYDKSLLYDDMSRIALSCWLQLASKEKMPPKLKAAQHKKGFRPFPVYTAKYCKLFASLGIATAQKLLKKFTVLKRPKKSSIPFQKFIYDQIGNVAQSCWLKIVPEKDMPPKIKYFQPMSAGVLSFYTLEQCKRLSEKEFKPVCRNTSISTRIKGVTNQNGLPYFYLQLYKDSPLKIGGLLECYLNREFSLKGLRILFPIKTTASWSMKPTVRTFNLSGTQKKLKSGTLKIIVKDAPNAKGIHPYEEFRTAGACKVNCVTA